MKQNDAKTVTEAERDRCWADLREHKDRIGKLIKNPKKLESFDFILFYQCIAIVIAEIVIYEEEFVENDEYLKKLREDKGTAATMLKMLRETNFWRDMCDKELSNEKRLVALHDLRKSVWTNMAMKKLKIMELVRDFPNLDNSEQMFTMMQCVAIVALNIDLQEREIELLY